MLTLFEGNCLFHALSDQLYGDQSQHARLRAETVEYMRQNPQDFKSFVIANPGGGIRRNPKRKNAGVMRETFDPTPPSEADINTAFHLSLDIMSKGGTYGDNAEVIAFSHKFNVDIRIWSVAIGAFLNIDSKAAENDKVPRLYIVHHVSDQMYKCSSKWLIMQTYEHYSSVRNIEGPFSGPPQVTFQDISPEAQKQLQRELAEGPKIEPWMIDLAMQSLPYDANRSIVEHTVKQCRGNINLAVDLLLPDTSPETSERSSSIEREPDSDDETGQKPTKKQDRRQSRPHPLSNNLAVRQKDSAPPTPSSPDPRHLAAALKKVDKTKKDIDPEETEDEDWKELSPYHDSESASVSTSASDYSTPDNSQPAVAGPIRFRLSQPKRPESLPRSGGFNHQAGSDRPIRASQPHRVIAKSRRKRLVNGVERGADLAKKSARNQQLANHISANSQQDNAPVLGIKAIQI